MTITSISPALNPLVYITLFFPILSHPNPQTHSKPSLKTFKPLKTSTQRAWVPNHWSMFSWFPSSAKAM